MTLNTSQVSYYMTQRKKGITQHISAMKAGISVRSGRRIEKESGQKQCSALAHTQRSSGSCVGQHACSSVEREAGSDTNNSAGDATG